MFELRYDINEVPCHSDDNILAKLQILRKGWNASGH